MKLFIPLFLLLFTFSDARSAEPASDKPKPTGDGWGAIFKMHWQNRVKAFNDQNLGWQHVILLGDSLTEGFDVGKHFPGRRVLNRGIGGDVIGNAMPPDDPRGVLRRLDSSVLDCAATDVFLLIGINDLNTGRKVEQMVEGYRELLSRLRAAAPRLRIHVQSLLPTRGKDDKQNKSVLLFNEQLKALSTEFECHYVDLHSLMSDTEGMLKTEFTADGLHLNDAAYQVWKIEILKAMQWSN